MREFTEARRESKKVMNDLEFELLNAVDLIQKKYKKLYLCEINYVLNRMLTNNIAEEIKDIFKKKKR